MNLLSRTFDHLRGNRAAETSAIAIAAAARASATAKTADDDDMTDAEKAEQEKADKAAAEKAEKAKARKEAKEKAAKEAKEAAAKSDEDDDDDDSDDDDDDDRDDDEEDDKSDKTDMKKKGSATAQARLRERSRCAAIFASPFAAGRPEVAANIAFNTDMSRREACALLASMGPVVKTKNGLREAMSATRQPNLGPDGGSPEASSPKAIQDSWAVAFGTKP